MGRLARDSRFLRRHLGLLGLLGAACVVAAQAAAAPAPTLFRLTIAGTAHQEWSYTPGPVTTGDCTRTVTSEGIRTVSFRTKAPVLVRLSGARVLPVNVRGIRGTVTLGGATTTDETCAAGGGMSNIADCAQTRRSFAGAKLHAASPRPRVLLLNGIANIRLAVATCPREPADVRRRPLGPSLSLLHLPRKGLFEGRLARFSLRASRSQGTVYASPEDGHLDERAEWTLTFVRVGG